MTRKTQGKTLFNVLSNDLRRRIFDHVSEEARSYTWLLEELDIESGHLAYHLRNMGGLIEKDENGIYRLSSLGLETLKILNEDRSEDTRTKSQLPLLLSLILVVIILSSLFILQNGDHGFGEIKYREESNAFLNETLDVIYVIFDEQEIDRNSLTELVINLVGLQDRLTKLSQLGYSDLTYFIEEISYFNSEFTEILKNSDDQFIVLTVEKRQLVRDLHSLLLELWHLL